MTTARRSPFRRVLGKGRRGVRRALIGQYGNAGQGQLDELWDWVNGMQQTVDAQAAQIAHVDRQVNGEATSSGEHLDLVVDQLWRRLEAADARLATELQRFAGKADRDIADLQMTMGRLRIESASILRLIGHEDKIVQATDGSDVRLPIARMTVFAEVERGPSDISTEKLRQYVHHFEGAKGPVIDLGCGKGEFLALLAEKGIEGYGVDLDDDAVATGKANGQDVRLEDLYVHLRELPADCLGGAFSSQVVEHLPPDTIAPLYEDLFRVVKPGGCVVIETPNPATFATHVQSFWRDPTHIRPVPMPTLDFAARQAGFVSEQTVFASPAPDHERLGHIGFEPQDPLLGEIVARFNANVDRLNDLLLGWQDYALVARKP